VNGEGVSKTIWVGLAVAVFLHALFLLSLPLGFLNPLFVEASEGLKQGSDFFGIYQAGTNAVHGYSIYDSQDYRHEAPSRVPFYYFYRYLPPTAFVAGLATLVLPPWTAYWIWVAICEILLLLVVRSILRDDRFPTGRRYLAAALWLGFFPFYLEQVMGQFSIIMAVFLWILWKQDGLSRRWHLGAWVGGISLKTFPVLFAFPYLRDRRFKLVLAGGACTSLISLPYFIFRPADLHEFARLNFSPFTPSLHKGSYGLHNFLRDALSHLPGGWSGTHVHIARWEMGLPGVLILAAGGIIGLLALWGTWRLADHPNRAALDLSLWTVAFFLVFKSIWEYHYVMLLPVVTALYLTTGSRTVLALGILLGLPTLYALAPALAGQPGAAPMASWPALFRSAHLAIKCLPTLVLFSWILRETGRTAISLSR
jgi:hypothetical protein